jgi:acetyl esterase/lipase
LRYWDDFWWKESEKEVKTCGRLESKKLAQVAETRECQARAFYSTPIYQEMRKRYRVEITTQKIGGVSTEVFTPAQGIAPKNAQRVLINLHGGGFRVGSRTFSHFESIPIAAVGRIKVISIDYRMAPQYAFPAASEDVESVYLDLIKRYDPKSIGIYGCSAGGLLTAQAIAWFQKKNLPMPGAVGMFCDGGSYWFEGDSGYFAVLWSRPPPAHEELPGSLREDPNFAYLKDADLNDSLAYPVRSKKVMARFPPSLLVSSTRDQALSSVVHTHSVLVQQRVPAELYVWEGLPHSFFVDPQLPQSREMYEVTTGFFDRYLARDHARADEKQQRDDS